MLFKYRLCWDCVEVLGLSHGEELESSDPIVKSFLSHFT